MRTYQVEVTQYVEIELDETKFTPEFMEEFRQVLYPFATIEAHAAHIAQLEARELLSPEFTEGYGPLKDMGISARVADMVTDVVTWTDERNDDGE